MPACSAYSYGHFLDHGVSHRHVEFFFVYSIYINTDQFRASERRTRIGIDNRQSRRADDKLNTAPVFDRRSNSHKSL